MVYMAFDNLMKLCEYLKISSFGLEVISTSTHLNFKFISIRDTEIWSSFLSNVKRAERNLVTVKHFFLKLCLENSLSFLQSPLYFPFSCPEMYSF